MNIGLIAMSGIRVCDAELLRLGFTLPGFVERSQVIASLPSLGLLTLAGMTPAAHKVSYFEIADLQASKTAGQLPGGFDLVAISSYSAQMNEAYELADLYRRSSVPVVLGGLHATSLPVEAAQHCDSVVIGEGEVSWLQLLGDAGKNMLQPFYGSVEDEFDLRDAPLPAFDLLEIEKYNRLTVQTSRGCPHRCEFCASSILLTKHYKQKPVEKVMAEIDKICEIWKNPFVEFADDNSIVDVAYWHELLPELKRREIRWFAETDLSVAKDARLLKEMRESGCAQVLIGLESPSCLALNGLETRNDWKAKQWPRYRDAIQAIQSQGISVNGCFIIGLDGQDATVFDEVFEFVRDSGLHEVQITVPTAFPGTPFYERLKNEARILEDENWAKCTLFDLNFRPQNMTETQLRQGFRDLALRLYSEEFTQTRRANFRRAMRRGKATTSSHTT